MNDKKTVKTIILLILSFFVFALNYISFAVEWSDFSWEKVTFIPQAYEQEYWLEFYFLPDNPKYGFACGEDGVFAKTSDSGKTWYASRIVQQFHAESVHFADTNIGYVSGCYGLYKTINGGKTWTLLTVGDGNNIVTPSWGNYIIGSEDIWVVEAFCRSVPVPCSIYKSKDGGSTWYQFTTKLANTSLSDIKMFEKNGLGYALSSGYLWKTVDGGLNWEISKQIPAVAWNTATQTASNWHEDLAISNNSILIPMSPGCAGGQGIEEGALAFSRDMGSTWTIFKTKGSMFGTYLINDSTGWGCGAGNEIYYTRDYGQNWIQMNCGIPLQTKLDDIWFVDDTTAFVSGKKNGGIFRLVKRNTNIDIVGNTVKCKYGTTTLTTDRKFQFYQWLQIQENGDTTIVGEGETFEATQTGKFLVRANNTNCSPIQSQPFNVNNYEKPEINIESNENSYCLGDTATVWIEKNKAIVSHKWLTNTTPEITVVSITDDTIRITTKKIGVHYVYLTFLDSNGCYDTLEYAVNFDNKAKPILEANGSLDFCKGDTRIIRLVNANLYDENTWFYDNKEIAKNVNEITINEAGKYYVVASINKRCENNSDTLETSIKNDIDLLDISENPNPFFIDSVHYGKEGYNYLKITNKGDKSLNISNIVFSKKIAFSIPLSQLPITIKPNETKYLLIYYAPTDIEMQSDTLFLQDNCTMRKIILTGFGKKNIDTAIANCGLKIKTKTISVDVKKILTVHNPLPNPVITTGKITYSITIESDDNYNNNGINEIQNDFTLQIYDALGNIIGTKFQKNILNAINNTKNKIEIGEIVFDLQQFNDGIYFIRLNFSNENIVLPIIKSQQ